MLDLYREYTDYIFLNARGYDIPVGELGKLILEQFPKAVVGDGTVKGIQKRGPRVKPVIVVDPLDSILVNRIDYIRNTYMKRKLTLAELTSV